jgi:hypothetical protein
MERIPDVRIAPGSMTGGADISECGRYRYRLWRRWGPGPSVVWLMLNPSTADAAASDHTIRKCIGFTKRWHHKAMEVVNLFAWRATDPRAMLMAAAAGLDIVGPHNDVRIQAALSSGELVVLGYGAHEASRIAGRAELVSGWLQRAYCLGVTASGQPRHPLTLSYDTALARLPRSELVATTGTGSELSSS